MTAATATPAAEPPSEFVTWRWALAASLILTILRLLALRSSPLELYPDEAQYWVWSRDLAFGYFSKPPMIAWLIRATTAPFGDAEFFVRVSSPLLHAAADLFLYAAGRRLYDAKIGMVALLLYALMPGVQLGAFVVSTDTPLCAFLAAALWLYVEIPAMENRRRLAAAAGFGAALGLAFLAKYAALYALIGVAAHLAISREARRPWVWTTAGAALLAFAIIATPNVAWNATHGFATIAHTADNAEWGQGQHFKILELLSFLGAQFGVFGPVPFAVLLAGVGVLAARRALRSADVLLICWTAPPLVIIAIEAFITRAHANWAASAYVSGSVLAAAWLLRLRVRWLTIATLAGQGVIAAAIMIGLAYPRLADEAHLSNALKRMRGWREITQTLANQAQVETLAAQLTAVTVDDRFLFNEATYYGRDFFGHGGPPLRAWVGAGPVDDEAKLAAPLTPAQGGRVLVGVADGSETKIISAAFARTEDLEVTEVSLDPNHTRRLDIFVGDGLRPLRPVAGR